MTKYVPMVLTPLGLVHFLGSTMTPEREQEIVTAQALRNMPRFGLEAAEENLDEYFRRVKEVLG